MMGQRKGETHRKLSFELRAKLLSVILIGNLDLTQSHGGRSAWDEVDRFTNYLPTLPIHQRENAKNAVKGRLTAILASQASFGTAAGAPVIFFAGAFVYSVIDVIGRLGDSAVANALAFGMWWMTIPLLAIVSSILLASNNPSTLAGFLGQDPPSPDPSETLSWDWVVERAYDTNFNTVSLWSRGVNKLRWYYRVHFEMSKGDRLLWQAADAVSDLRELKTKMTIKNGNWAMIILFSVFIVSAPSLLALFTSYFTPRVGLSCRSMTFMMYLIAQLLQMTAWLVGTFYIMERDIRRNNDQAYQSSWPRVLWWTIVVLISACAVFSGVGGTLMQLIGVYNNCKCKMPVWYWGNTEDPGAFVILSSNTADSINAAKRYWQAIAITATVILCVACALGWWWQRRLRLLFRKLVEDIAKNTNWESLPAQGNWPGGP